MHESSRKTLLTNIHSAHTSVELDFWTYQLVLVLDLLFLKSYQPGIGIGFLKKPSCQPGPGINVEAWFLVGTRPVCTMYVMLRLIELLYKAGVTSTAYQASIGTRLVLLHVTTRQVRTSLVLPQVILDLSALWYQDQYKSIYQGSRLVFAQHWCTHAHLVNHVVLPISMIWTDSCQPNCLYKKGLHCNLHQVIPVMCELSL